MRLLASEVRRLWRPLLFGTALCLVAAGMVLTRGGALLGQANALKSASGVSAPHGLVFTSPTGIGRVAAGLMASLPGLFALLVLARRPRGGGVVGADAEVRAAAGRSALALGGRQDREPVARRRRARARPVGRARALDLRASALVAAARAPRTRAGARCRPARRRAESAGARPLRRAGTLAAVLTHSMLGTVLGGTFVVGGSMALSNIAFTRELPSYWLTGWMRFHALGHRRPVRAVERQVPARHPLPERGRRRPRRGRAAGGCVAVAGILFARSDVMV